MLQMVFQQGLLYGIMAMGVFLSFRILAVPDLTVDGSFPLGGAVAATLIAAGFPALPATLVAVAAGAAAGGATGWLHARLRVPALLAGILTMTALFSVNLRVMGRPNVPLLRLPTLMEDAGRLGIPFDWAPLVVFAAAVALVAGGLLWWLRTELGLALRAAGDNEAMASSAGVQVGRARTVGLAISNGLGALSGALAAQYQGFADVNMGVGTIVAGLASVILGEAIVRPRGLAWRLAAAVTGSLAYRAASAAALQLGLDPGDLKLATAAVVAIALAVPGLARDRLRAGVPVQRPGGGLWRSLAGHGLLSAGHRRPPPP
ncbi:MAG: ABC transporter permease [Firmicutes bacterium]|nr:ABC transporter permease [Bacillota bacterium]